MLSRRDGRNGKLYRDSETDGRESKVLLMKVQKI